MSGTYVVGTDLSPASWRGAEVAAALAAHTGADLDFFCAVHRNVDMGMGEFLGMVRGNVSKKVASLARRYEAAGLGTSFHVTASDDPANALVKYAEKRSADLIVVAPQGVSRWKKMVLGSVTEQVMRKAPAMMLIARPKNVDSRRVLIAVDLSKGSTRALRIGLEMARDLGAQAQVLQVLRPPGMAIRLSEELSGVDAHKTRRARVKHANAALSDWVAEHPSKGVKVRTTVVEGNPPEVILREAEKRRASLIVMGTHGKGRAQELFVGSVARAVASTAPVSVLLVRALPRKRKRKKKKG